MLLHHCTWEEIDRYLENCGNTKGIIIPVGSGNRIKVIKYIQKHPDSVTNIAKATRQNRSAVSREINAMEKFGLVKTHEKINPGHGKIKIVELVAQHIKLEAVI